MAKLVKKCLKTEFSHDIVITTAKQGQIKQSKQEREGVQYDQYYSYYRKEDTTNAKRQSQRM